MAVVTRMEWITKDDGPSFGGRKWHAACGLADDVWVFGGVTAEGFSDDLIQVRQVTSMAPLSFVTHCAEGARPPPMSLHTMVAYDVESECIVFGGLVPYAHAAGGSSSPSHVGTNSLWRLHTGLPGASGCAWTAPECAGQGPSPRIGHCAAVRDLGADGTATMFVYGGLVPDFVIAAAGLATAPPDAADCLNDLIILSLPSWEWSRPRVSVSDCSPPPCFAASLTCFGSNNPYLLLFGGSDANGQSTHTALLLDADAMMLSELRLPDSSHGEGGWRGEGVGRWAAVL